MQTSGNRMATGSGCFGKGGDAPGAPPASSGVVYGMAMTDKIRLTQYAAKSG